MRTYWVFRKKSDKIYELVEKVEAKNRKELRRLMQEKKKTGHWHITTALKQIEIK